MPAFAFFSLNIILYPLRTYSQSLGFFQSLRNRYPSTSILSIDEKSNKMKSLQWRSTKSWKESTSTLKKLVINQTKRNKPNREKHQTQKRREEKKNWTIKIVNHLKNPSKLFYQCPQELSNHVSSVKSTRKNSPYPKLLVSTFFDGIAIIACNFKSPSLLPRKMARSILHNLVP